MVELKIEDSRWACEDIFSMISVFNFTVDIYANRNVHNFEFESNLLNSHLSPPSHGII